MDSPAPEEAQPERERSRPPAPHGQAPERVGDERSALRRLAGQVGNRGLGRIVARMRDGEGILPGGLVHPNVEAAIAGVRGGGTPLDGGAARRIGPAVGHSLSDARVHTDAGAAALARAVSARAFTVGSDIFFASGEYRPGTSGGDALIAHEAAHVIQQRGAPATGPLTVSQPGDALEREAEAVANGAGL